jgi:hypothetical protein
MTASPAAGWTTCDAEGSGWSNELIVQELRQTTTRFCFA